MIDRTAKRVPLFTGTGNRWTSSRKAAVVQAIADGVCSADDVYRVYQITPEELAQWRKLYREHGQQALRATRLQMYRPLPAARRQTHRRK